MNADEIISRAAKQIKVRGTFHVDGVISESGCLKIKCPSCESSLTVNRADSKSDMKELAKRCAVNEKEAIRWRSIAMSKAQSEDALMRQNDELVRGIKLLKTDSKDVEMLRSELATLRKRISRLARG